MGALRFVFEIKDNRIYENIERLGWLKSEQNSTDETGIEGVVIRNFRGTEVPSFLEPFFVAKNYRANYGDYHRGGRVPTGMVFGPATVLCYGLNSGDLGDAEEKMKKGIKSLKDNVGEIKSGLRYEGLYFADDRLLVKGGLILQGEGALLSS